MVFHTTQARDKTRRFIQKRKEAFERFRSKQKEASQIRQARASIKRKSVLGRTEQKIGKERKRVGEKLKIAREKADVRKQQMELKRLRSERFRSGFAGQVATGAGKLTRAGIKAARTQTRSPARRRIPVRRVPRLQQRFPSGKRIPKNLRRKFKRQFKVTRKRRKPQREGLFFE